MDRQERRALRAIEVVLAAEDPALAELLGEPPALRHAPLEPTRTTRASEYRPLRVALSRRARLTVAA